jgi:proline iminopeptidase
MQNNPLSLFPEITPYYSDNLYQDQLHHIFYEVSGNPNGYPVVFLHGGPGSGTNPSQRRFFDPSFYKIILIDQRGCGSSKPQGSIISNTTSHLVADIEAIRIQLKIDQWLVFGGSWGSTLALNYAIAHPKQVSGLILRGIFLSRQSELNWFLGEIQHFYPDVWQKLLDFLPPNQHHDVLTAFSEQIFNVDPAINRPAAVAWNAYESAIMRLLPSVPESKNKPESESQSLIEAGQDIEVARARIQIHYIQHSCFIDGDAVLKQCATLDHIPTTIVQGRYDMVCPPKSAWDLSRVMPNAEFIMVPDAGHSAMETGVVSALVGATEKFKTNLLKTNSSIID